MKRLYVYVDASVIGGCEDSEFAEASLALWRLFVKGAFVQYIVNLGRIRLFNAVNLEQGYGLIEIRTPREVLADEEDI
jgi:hypothetical protein